ncbi:glutathione S-transferase family protein [Kordiimonas aestuarii]|uniref:glutathione S-transferase family protein n=1 Tax=Kordiimonas aestuarii TaxID=1005925 RepID=UPI0021D262C7|nr:glutathione S-transferase family protein [Kordiimonas aestuarii]
MAITCYFGSGSPFSWRVMLAMEVKGLEYKAVELHFSKGETKTPEHMARNPRAKVPVLVDGDLTIYESTAILAYLERAYPDVPVFGHDNREAAQIWQRMAEVENYLGQALTSGVGPIFRGEIKGHEAEIQKHLSRLESEIDLVEGWLAESDFVAGDRISAADMTLYPLLALIERVSPRLKEGFEVGFFPLRKQYPHIAGFMKRIEALDGYDRTYPPHWREAA